jgi:hypothetical protein
LRSIRSCSVEVLPLPAAGEKPAILMACPATPFDHHQSATNFNQQFA